MSGLIIRVMALKYRAMYQYGVGGGVVDKKKISTTPPVKCRIVDVGGENKFFYS